MKVGIVAPYSWSFWGAVVEHVELQADALRRLGVDTRTIMGNDPPGSFTRILHPRLGRHGHPPPDVIPVGRSVIVPANGSLPNIVLSPRSVPAIRRALEWMKIGKPLWGFLADRLDYRIAVSPHAQATAEAWLPGEYEVVPNGVLIPVAADPHGREHRIVFAGRQEPRKGLHVLLRA